jgi:hypothetical protein
LGIKLGDTHTFDEELRDGIALAQLAKLLEPSYVKKIHQDRTKLHFKHSDNINNFLKVVRILSLPEHFIFELTDLYDKKNIPKVIYCIHAFRY